MQRIAPLTPAEEKMLKLRHEEESIQDKLVTEPHLANDQLDFTAYDELMSQLREVRAEMTTLVL
jgi:hypothetical protein